MRKDSRLYASRWPNTRLSFSRFPLFQCFFGGSPEFSPSVRTSLRCAFPVGATKKLFSTSRSALPEAISRFLLLSYKAEYELIDWWGRHQMYLVQKCVVLFQLLLAFIPIGPFVKLLLREVGWCSCPPNFAVYHVLQYQSGRS